MAKAKAVKKTSKKRASEYEKKLSIIGSLDDVLKVSVASARKPQKQSGKKP